MVLIFHQNMKDFGGGSAIRNAAFNGAYTAINAATGAYLVAGFTEVTNNATSRHQLSNLAGILDPGLTNLLVIAVGTMAVSGRPEYIGIAWDPLWLTVQHAGQVLRNPVNGIWTVYNNNPAPPSFPVAAGRILLPAFGAPLAADSRGLAYIAGIYAGNPYIFAFMHNMYAIGDKTGAFSNLNSMGQSIRNTIGGAYAGAEIIIGGDFNLQPRDPKRPRNAALTMVHRAAQAGGLVLNTTVANPYDFWVTSRTATPTANCTIYTQARRDVRLSTSDHAAISLNR
jgi:hypothetical protein